MLPPWDYWNYEQDPKLLGQGAMFALKLFVIFVVVSLLVVGLLFFLS